MVTKSTGSDTPAETTEKVVKYIGTADVREIDSAAWKNVGVEDQNKVVWDRKNQFTVPVKDLQPGAVRYCDEDDEGFVVTEA